MFGACCTLARAVVADRDTFPVGVRPMRPEPALAALHEAGLHARPGPTRVVFQPKQARANEL